MTVTDLLSTHLKPLVTRRHLLALGVSESDVDRIWQAIGVLERPGGSRNTYATREAVLGAWEEVRRT